MAIEDVNIMFYNVWDTVEQPDPIPGPSTEVLGPGDHGKHHDSHLVDSGLTYSFQTPAGSNATQDGAGQPSYSVHHWAEPQPESHPQPTGFLGWDASSVNPAELEACTLMPAPSSGKNLFHFTPLRSRVLTNHEQLRSTTGMKARAGPRSVHSARYVSNLDYPYTNLINPFNSRMSTRNTSSALAQPGLSWDKEGGSSLMEHPVLGQPSTSMRRQGRRPCHLPEG